MPYSATAPRDHRASQFIKISQSQAFDLFFSKCSDTKHREGHRVADRITSHFRSSIRLSVIAAPTDFFVADLVSESTPLIARPAC